MPLTPHDIALEIVRREGGWADDPDDPGGPTKFGVTLRTLKGLGIDLDGDGDVDVDDLKLLSVPQAADIFLEHYFRRPRIAELAAKYPHRGVALRACVFDMQVHSGSNAVELLQKLCKRLTNRDFGKIDGAIGRRTLGVVETIAERGVEDLAHAYAIARRNFYFRLADRRVKSRKYVRRNSTGGKAGWIVRAEEFLPPELRLTDRQFRERVAQW